MTEPICSATSREKLWSSYLDDGKTVTSLDVGIGPSVGASARVDDTNTTFYPILSGRF